MGFCSWSLAFSLGGVHHGIDDLLVACTAADVAADRISDLLFRRMWVVCYQGVTSDEHAGGAVAALEGMLFTKCILYFCHDAALGGQAFYSGHTHFIGLNGKHTARANGFIVQQNSACTTHTMLTANVRACEAQFIADEINQAGARLYQPVLVRAVDLNLDRFEKGVWSGHVLLDAWVLAHASA